MSIRSHTFRGKRWRIVERKLNARREYANCDPPGKPRKCITIDPRWCGADRLEFLLHEAIHVCLWDLDEVAVTETAHDVTRFLRRHDLRFADEE